MRKHSIIEESKPAAENETISEEEMRKDMITYFQERDAKLREKGFQLAFKIISNEEDKSYTEVLAQLSEQICYFINEKNLKIQMVLLKILEVLVDKDKLALQEKEKMFTFNIFDKFLSSNNRKLKNGAKEIFSKIFSMNSSAFFEVLKGLLAKANVKMAKSILFFINSNDCLVDLDEFMEIEDELTDFCVKYYGNRMKDIKTGTLKLIQLAVSKFGEDFLSNISKISSKDKGNDYHIQ
jgi:hypothetical protein